MFSRSLCIIQGDDETNPTKTATDFVTASVFLTLAKPIILHATCACSAWMLHTYFVQSHHDARARAACTFRNAHTFSIRAQTMRTLLSAGTPPPFALEPCLRFRACENRHVFASFAPTPAFQAIYTINQAAFSINHCGMNSTNKQDLYNPSMLEQCKAGSIRKSGARLVPCVGCCNVCVWPPIAILFAHQFIARTFTFFSLVWGKSNTDPAHTHTVVQQRLAHKNKMHAKPPHVNGPRVLDAENALMKIKSTPGKLKGTGIIFVLVFLRACEGKWARSPFENRLSIFH